jgi:hypothetical protein
VFGGKTAQEQQVLVEFVDWQIEEATEDVFSIAVALQRAREFTEPRVRLTDSCKNWDPGLRGKILPTALFGWQL